MSDVNNGPHPDAGGPGPGLHVAVIGAGVAGLTAAILLSRAGHRVSLLEQDRLEDDPDDRPGTPQSRHSHAFLGRLRKLLASELPDVLADLHAAGATDYHILDDLPETVDDRSPRPGDEDLVLLACRRSTFEAVLRQTARRSPNLELLDGAQVSGVITAGDPQPNQTPTVTGVQLGEQVLPADVVIGAGGPRSPVPTWLDAIGVTVPDTFEESGIVYLTRFYRLRDDLGDRPHTGDALGLSGADLGYIKCAIFRGDNHTFSATLAPRTTDEELRIALRDPDRFQRACRMFKPIAPWVDPDRAQPLGGVNVMARLGNRQRRFLDHDAPLVLGFHALGDAHTSTNPLYGRGCTMAVLQATLLVRAVQDHPTDPAARALAYEAATAEQIEPWYHVSVAQDRFNHQRAAAARAAKQGSDQGGNGNADTTTGAAGAGSEEEIDGAAFIGKLVRDGLLPAARTDAVVARAFLRVLNALQTPQSMMTDADIAGRIMQTMASPPPDNLAVDYRVRRRDLIAAVM